MTPTLPGRWQIRVFLLTTLGLIISLPVSLVVGNVVPLFVLLYVLLFGLAWDVIYQFITSYRWDRDWPTSFQVAAGIIEGALVWGLILTKKLPGIPAAPPFIVFLVQYGVIWLSIFVLTQGPLRVFWLKWRYQGGQWFVSRGIQAGEPTHQQQPSPALQIAGRYNHRQPSPPRLFARVTRILVKASLACKRYSHMYAHVDLYLIAQSGIFAPGVAGQRCSDECQRSTVCSLSVRSLVLILSVDNTLASQERCRRADEAQYG